MSNFKPIGRNRKLIRQEKPEKIFKQMTNDHVDVLQNIEFSIVSAYRRSSNIKYIRVAFIRITRKKNPKLT